jgi:hypothetical protein
MAEITGGVWMENPKTGGIKKCPSSWAWDDGRKSNRGGNMLPQKSYENQAKSIVAAMSLVDVVTSRGIELHPSGPGRYRALCPFHSEKTPSFFVFDSSNKYHCFGCGEHGDAIDFIRKIDGLSFRDAVERLTGVAPGHYRPDPVVVRKRQAMSGFERWKSAYSSFLGTLICGCHFLLSRECRHPGDLERFIGIIDLQSFAQLHLDAIVSGNQERIAEVFRQFLAGELNYV